MNNVTIIKLFPLCFINMKIFDTVTKTAETNASPVENTYFNSNEIARMCICNIPVVQPNGTIF